MSLADQLARSHQRLNEVFPTDYSPRGGLWPLAAADIARLEQLVGFSFSPLLREMLSTEHAMPNTVQ